MTDGQLKIDCLEALDRLYEYLDEELTPVRAEEVRRHLEKCAPCLAVSNFESAYLKFVEARAKAREAPEKLRRQLLERLLFEPDDPPGS
jgi:anti-sigma factor (TIGR02949 family)